MSETIKTENRTIGFFWEYSREVESVSPVEGTRASAKNTTKVKLGGNAETYELMIEQLNKAKYDAQ